MELELPSPLLLVEAAYRAAAVRRITPFTSPAKDHIKTIAEQLWINKGRPSQTLEQQNADWRAAQIIVCTWMIHFHRRDELTREMTGSDEKHFDDICAVNSILNRLDLDSNNRVFYHTGLPWPHSPITAPPLLPCPTHIGNRRG